MYWQIQFHESPPGPIPNNNARSLYFAALSDADLGPSGYLKSSFQGVELIRSHRALPVEDNSKGCSVNCQPLLHYRRPDTSPAPKTAVTLITACDIAPHSHNAFLNQFKTAATYMIEQAAHLRFCLYRSLEYNTPFTFINLATWHSVEAFVRVFQSTAFETLIQGGFQPRSQIVVTQPPVRRRSDVSN